VDGDEVVGNSVVGGLAVVDSVFGDSVVEEASEVTA
jgi:hypothetical protein